MWTHCEIRLLPQLMSRLDAATRSPLPPPPQGSPNGIILPVVSLLPDGTALTPSAGAGVVAQVGHGTAGYGPLGPLPNPFDTRCGCGSTPDAPHVRCAFLCARAVAEPSAVV